MDDDEVQILIALSDRLRITAAHCLLVQRMVNGDTLDFRNAGQSRDRIHLIDHDRVDNIARHTDAVADLAGKNRTEVRCVLAVFGFLQFFDNFIRHFIGAALDRLEDTAAADADIDGTDGDVILRESIQNDLLAEVLLRIYV